MNRETIEAERGATWRQKQRQVREEAILDAARSLIAENGYDSMRMEELAERVGISKPTLYQHFPSKEMVAVRAVVSLMEQNVQFLQDLDPNLTAIERIDKLVRWIIVRRFSNGHLLYGCTKTSLVPVVRPHPEYQSVRRDLVEKIAAIFERAAAQGYINPNMNTRVAVQLLFSMVRDTEYDELIAGGECSAEEVQDTLTAFFMSGLNAK